MTVQQPGVAQHAHRVPRHTAGSDARSQVCDLECSNLALDHPRTTLTE